MYVYTYTDNSYRVLIEQLATVPLAERKHRILLNCLVFQDYCRLTTSSRCYLRTHVEINNSAGHAAKNLKVSAVIARNFIPLGCFLALESQQETAIRTRYSMKSEFRGSRVFTNRPLFLWPSVVSGV